MKLTIYCFQPSLYLNCSLILDDGRNENLFKKKIIYIPQNIIFYIKAHTIIGFPQHV
jgi:hypothetical protein